MRIKRVYLAKLITHVNRKKWWHVTPTDPGAYQKRGKFYASSFGEAEFYGRPNDVPERVSIANPFVCDNVSIEKELLGRVATYEGISFREIAAIDAGLRRAALRRGFDSIVLLSKNGLRSFRATGKIPRNIELNILNPAHSLPPATRRKATEAR